MKAPILEYFDGEGLINKENRLKKIDENNEKVSFLRKNKIDTALFVFVREYPEFLKKKLKPFYTFKDASREVEVYCYEKKFLIVSSFVGGAAAGNLMEELGFLGITNFYACGSAGLVEHEKVTTPFVLPTKAIRGEGLSYHYLKPSVYVETDKEGEEKIARFLISKKIDFERGVVWTTDAFYRETPKEIAKRRKQGAVCVDMECASWCAIAKYRGYRFAQMFYISDVVKEVGWELKIDRNELRSFTIKLMVEFLSKNNK